MKKLIFLGLSVVALTGCSSSVSNSNQLVGDWRCTIDYDDFNIRTVDNLKFAANGNVLGQGSIHYPMQKPIFIYTVQNSGRWTLKNSRIVYRVLAESIQRNHNANVWAELQRDSELQQYEDSLFNTLSEKDSNKTIELTVTDFDNTEMDIKQEIKGHKTYKGQCVKK
ncbi:membrane lipoprotein lipid attachment site-containing protein [Mannheimia granulomatis]|uniref:membrane lipoprotein lipid attachment site-containing protein n=1 Tax=Mannheimia granulomatis TaxID=85402 RepID=UPI00047B6B78|nr:membrane lipoprotein lipid attachment site-containing protein [Mannheimia granulomatis]QLB18531.1 hypothetical protein A6B41_03245 [Mannheimia granulomatis]